MFLSISQPPRQLNPDISKPISAPPPQAKVVNAFKPQFFTCFKSDKLKS